jgi:hypothetical protein
MVRPGNVCEGEWDMDTEELDRPADLAAEPALPVAGWEHLRVVDARLRAQGVDAELRRDVGRAISASWRAVGLDEERAAWHQMTEVCRRVVAALPAKARR